MGIFCILLAPIFFKNLFFQEQNKKLKRELALGKVVRIPRGNFPGMASTDDDGRKEQVELFANLC